MPLTFYTTDGDRFMEASPLVQGRLAQTGCRHSSTLLGVARPFHPNKPLEIEATAVIQPPRAASLSSLTAASTGRRPVKS